MRRLVLALILATACATGGGRGTTALEHSHWRLVELGGQPALGADGTGEAVLEVGDSARVAGSTGCNRLSGPFTRDGDALRFGPAAVTRMACVDAGRNQQEQAFLGALRATERHRVAGDTLVLVGPAGDLARLVVAARPAGD